METRLTAVRRIPNAVVGDREPVHSGQGKFWDKTRNEFVATVVRGLRVVVPGDPAASALLAALRGDPPFDGSRFARMPLGGPTYVSDADIAFIEQWIRDGAPDNDLPARAAVAATPLAPVVSIPDLTTELRGLVAELKARPHGERLELADGKTGVPKAVQDTLVRSLRAAIRLEFATIPPYLMAMWSVERAGDPVARAIRSVVMEEMLHLGLACNLLVGVDPTQSPGLNLPDIIPDYPVPLPGNVNPALKIPLRRLTPSQLQVFMAIEYPAGGPIGLTGDEFDTIGAFYAALLATFETVGPAVLDGTKQREEGITGLFKVLTLADVRRAIGLIRTQGEGSSASPEETPGQLAHFYQFRQIFVGAKFVPDPVTGVYSHSGAPIPMPGVLPVADIPRGGYLKAAVPDDATWKLIESFDTTFNKMLGQLELAWRDPAASLGDYGADDPVATMGALTDRAREVMAKFRPDGVWRYGPSFRIV